MSNYINHHQLPFCRAMQDVAGDVEFWFVQTMPMEEKRVNMGWGVDESTLPFLVLYYNEEQRAKELIENSDVVLFGWTEGLIADLEKKRLSSGKLSFRVSERIYREGQWKAISPRGLINKYREHFVHRDKPVYLLCTGAYVASDFDLIKSYPGKKLKWGYFPDAEAGADSNEPVSVSADDGRTIHICWAGRLIELKHPEYAVKVAAHLKNLGRDFVMDIVGDGPLKQELQSMVRDNGLEGCVSFAGAVPPSRVLEYMREADIFLFTSNYLEGWGAVVNEAMQSGCAVVASLEAGAVPFLIDDGVNGLVYRDGSYAEFERKVSCLFEHREMIRALAGEARTTVRSLWNASNAASQLVRFAREYLEGKEPVPADKGPMSRAEVIKPPGFKRTFQEKNRLE